MAFVVIFITVPNRETGVAIADRLVEERLAACVNIVPGVFSVYRWQGKIERESEELLVVKTREDLTGEVIARVKQLHPYTVPEILALPVAQGSDTYLEWLQAETAGGPDLDALQEQG